MADEVLKTVTPALIRGNIFWLTVSIGMLFPFLWFFNRATRLVISKQKVVLEKGIVAKATSEVRIKNIRTINVTQGVIDRIMGVGKIEIGSLGDKPEIVVGGIGAPHDVKKLIEAQLDD